MELYQDTEKNKCSEKQTDSSEQHLGGAHPKEYCKSMGADQTVLGEKLELDQEMEKSRCSVIQIPKQHLVGTRPKKSRRDVGADELIPGEKLELCQEMEKSSCSVIQMNVPKQNLGRALPKKYRRDMGADQVIPAEKLELCQEVQERGYSVIQIHIPEQQFGSAHPKKYGTDMSSDQAIPDQDDGPKKYYAVSFPKKDFLIKGNPLVYEQKKDALQVIRQYPGARFREFTSRTDALQYASTPYDTQGSSSLLRAYLMFKPLVKHELVKFQNCIKDGDLTNFLKLVWSNPRCLVDKNDYPTVIQDQTQSNALHMAVIHGQIIIFVQILHVLQDTEFMSVLYPKDELSRIQTRIRCLVGFYLNRTENVYFETPLQLACRFGHGDIVQIILTFCESLLENKVDKSVENIICRRHNCLPNHKRSILHLFTELYYVPIVQDEVCKYVDEPCDAQTVLAAMTTHPVKAGSPGIYCAFAGPAPLETAKQFYHDLKRNKYTFLKISLNTVMASFQKHIEEDGRKLSKKYRIGWIEYWRSLDAWLEDISSLKGLKLLEKHLNKLDTQITILHNEPPPFIDIIKNFVKEFVVKISEIAVTCDKLSLFHDLQTLVLFMDCFLKYPFSNETALFSIHEELGHILFLKLTDDNHRNFENFQILKLLLLSQLSYVACYQKSIWKMFCCILRFASYFQQDSEFVMKPVCQCIFPVVEDSYVYSSRSCHSKVLSWRQDITNELVQKYADIKNPVLEERETPNIPLSSDDTAAGKDHDFAADICTLEHYIQLYAMDQVHMYKKYFFQTYTFIFAYCNSILNSYKVSENFIEIFQDVIKSWEPLCKLNYQEDIHLTLIHCEMAFCLFVQFCHIPPEIVQWCKIHLKTEISCTSLEWTHLMCVTSLLLTMLDGNECDTSCKCQYYINRPATESFHPSSCFMLLRRLSKKLGKIKFRTSEYQMRSNLVESKEEGGSDQSNDKEESYATQPDSSPRTKEIYVRGLYVGGDTLTIEDVSIYNALVEARVDISKYHHIGKWKNLVEHVLPFQMHSRTIKQIAS